MNKTVAILAIIGTVTLAQFGMDNFPERGGPGGPGGPGGRRGPGDRWGPGGPGGRGGHHPHGPPPPPYLRNVSDSARQEYFSIVKNMTLTIAQQKEEINAWGERNGIAVSSRLPVEEALFEIYSYRTKQNVTQLVSELPQAIQRVSEIMDNEDQTPRQLFEALRNLTEENPRLYNIAKFATEAFMRRPHGPHGGPGGRGGPGGMPPPPFGGPDTDFGAPDFGRPEFQQNNGFGSQRGMNGFQGTHKLFGAQSRVCQQYLDL
ncbi:unnamed protein product [Strongylus vulgaris]|uniref:SXP/RAL-2 family protein Ani s 5-like cation-binding domain-containing protein n=1 Tax=Strongylus vulgaris TaxID=40348 RepID=A0A3P7IGA3_STRVU|nr:unnamed protein product [Strongylus vulgaris]